MGCMQPIYSVLTDVVISHGDGHWQRGSRSAYILVVQYIYASAPPYIHIYVSDRQAGTDRALSRSWTCSQWLAHEATASSSLSCESATTPFVTHCPFRVILSRSEHNACHIILLLVYVQLTRGAPLRPFTSELRSTSLNFRSVFHSLCVLRYY